VRRADESRARSSRPLPLAALDRKPVVGDQRRRACRSGSIPPGPPRPGEPAASAPRSAPARPVRRVEILQPGLGRGGWRATAPADAGPGHPRGATPAKRDGGAGARADRDGLKHGGSFECKGRGCWRCQTRPSRLNLRHTALPLAPMRRRRHARVPGSRWPSRTWPDPELPGDGAVDRGTGHRAVPQRLARLDGPRRRDPAAARPRSRGWPAWSAAVGAGRARRAGWGDRVTVPFCCGWRSLRAVPRGATQRSATSTTSPGFTAWGSFAEAGWRSRFADLNCVAPPRGTSTSADAAALGCRFMTAYAARGRPRSRRAGRVAGRARLAAGVGPIRRDAGQRGSARRVVAVDVSAPALALGA